MTAGGGPVGPGGDRPAGGRLGGSPAAGPSPPAPPRTPSPPTAASGASFAAQPFATAAGPVAHGPDPAAAVLPYLPHEFPREGAPSLGRSLALDEGDLVLDGRSPDLALVVGAEALRQALELGVATQRGSDRLNTPFGFDRLALGAYAHDLPTRKEFLTMELVRCLSSDLRVTDVREVFFDDDPRYLELRPGIDEEDHRREVAAAHAARVHTVFAVVDTIASTALTLRARGTP
ncbi:hypothetical protein [Streptomyces sp. WAC08241]|uniref:hypothetical protein n=1 Tax=Streptomyces sp. WAC08241 TaxID=2487421 RepID=UPI000F7BA0FF|nr:hypothetical protein [Streptomyces sp. WAC08241]RSS41928.1 hypothetical protein EF906_13410 [Streptomyces sp. WAC08241]